MMFKKQIVIDPVKANLVNRIAANSRLVGNLEFDGGVLLHGCIKGETATIKSGPLVIPSGGVALGNIIVYGDCYVFGCVGDPASPESEVRLEVHGTIHVADGAKTYGVLACRNLATYAGCEVNSKVVTIHDNAPSTGATE
ncbi:polymer-forming cytoskeletal protein [Acidovorax delafieldii]|jgi:cytoskeletal protein CcmA (bactofilin family)|uniref:hypothetical protein n=1 Tax=Acidovorax delafieldii TaxID=47920 RepID=UPI003ECD62F6